MASRPSPPKPYERGRPPGPSSGALTPLSSSQGSSSRPPPSAPGYASSSRPPVREEFARARAYDNDHDSYSRDRPLSSSLTGGYGNSYSSSSNSYNNSSSLSGPRPPPRPWDSSSRYGSYGGGYGSGYGSYGSGYGGGYGDSYNRYSSYGGYGGGYGGYGSMSGGGYGGYGSSMYGGGYGMGLNPYSRDPKYLMMGPDGPQGFGAAVESQFGWVHDFGNIVQTFARISWLLDMNLETMYGSFASMLRFFDRIRFMNLTDLAPAVQAVVFLATLGVAGAKLAEFFRAKAHGGEADIEAFQRQFKGAAGGRRSKHMWTFVLLGLIATFIGTPLLFRLLGRVFNKAQKDAAALPTRLRALYDFEGETPADLPFRAGDVIEIVGKRGEGWLEGKLPNGRIGLLPENYVAPAEEQQQQQQAEKQAQEREAARPVPSLPGTVATPRVEELTSM